MRKVTPFEKARALLAKRRELFVPKDVSWRVADQLVKQGFATIYPFEQRWLGKITATDKHPTIPTTI